jgi:Ca2+-transporting ATPase
MIIDGIIFGLCIAAGYIFSYNYALNNNYSIEHARILAGTVSFAITLLSPQIYVFILREGNVFEKFKRKNLLLKIIFISTLIMILGIIYIPALNTLFKTTPIYDIYLWVTIIFFSCLTTIVRAILKENIIFNFRKEKNRSNVPETS